MNRKRLQYWVGVLASFLLGQGSVQFFNLISGFLLLRWLTVEAYAQFSAAFAFQSTLAMLVDLGFSGSIVALVGQQGEDKKTIGSYIRSAKYFRNKTFIIVVPLAVILFPLLVFKQNWDWKTQLFLLGAIIVSVFFQGWVSYYSAPLLIRQRLKDYYQPQIFTAIGRLLLCYILHFKAVLFSWVVLWLTTLSVTVNGILYQQRAEDLFEEPNEVSPEANKEMLRYLLPMIPGIIFVAFQGQISTFIISFFGQTSSIAEVGALGRLNQLFLILNSLNGVVVGPYIAKLIHSQLLRKYLFIVGCSVIISLVICAIAFLFPKFFLLLLGPNYSNLEQEVGWTILGGCLYYVSGVIWNMNTARKWVYLGTNVAYICLVSIAQIMFAYFIDMRATINVIYLSVLTATIGLIVNTLTGVYGFNFYQGFHTGKSAN